MAEGPSSAKQALEKLNEQLTCPICLERYTDPKLLQCFHVFCEKCIQKCLKPVAHQTPEKQVVECPTCRQSTSLPQNGVSGLQGAFLIHHLFDIQDLFKKVITPAETKCVNCEKQVPTCYCHTCGFLCGDCKTMHLKWKEFSSHKIVSLDKLTEDVTNLVPPVQKVLQCSKHPTKELDHYCETCKEVICHYCILNNHLDHQYDLATDAFPQQKNVLIASVEPAEQQLASVNKALGGLDTLCGKITSQRQDLEMKIKANFHLIHKALEARQEELIAHLGQMTQQKLKNVAAQQDQLELVATRLKSCCGFLQESLRTGSQVEILAMTAPFVKQVQDVTSSFEPKCLVPEEQADLEFSSRETEMTQICQQFGQVNAVPVCHDKCHAKGTCLHVPMVGETTTATVDIKNKQGDECQRPVEVSCELVSIDGCSQVRGEVKKVKDSQYEISYHPQHRGYHYLHIQVENKHIARSPFPVSVLTTTPTKIITDLNGPRGLALNSHGQLAVVEREGHCISIFSGNGENRGRFSSYGSGPDQLYSPGGVALSATGDILVCDQGNHRIQVFLPDGKSVKCFGTYSNRPLEYPLGIAVHPKSKKIYVAEFGNNRVQILNDDLTFCSTFGSKGSDNGQFLGIFDISFDSAGHVYITDTDNHRVQMFTVAGEYIRHFGKKGSGKGELNGPTGIAIDSNNIIYVCDSNNHRISLFAREGHFLRSFGTQGEGPGQFNNPSGITIANNGVVYISDITNKRVQIF